MKLRKILLPLLLALAASAFAAEKPKVRAVTGFVQLDRAAYRQQITTTLAALRAVKTEIEKAGYEVEDVRIATQPFAEYTRGLSREQALAFFKEYEALVEKEKFSPSIGPADVASAPLLADALRHSRLLGGSIIVADENGVRWDAVRAAARLMKDFGENSPDGYAAFNFAATAMLPPHTPFYPGAYNAGPGKKFAVAWEAANVVAEAFQDTHADAALAHRKLADALAPHARAIEAAAQRAARQTGWKYLGLDLSPAPLRDVSIGRAIENFLNAPIGSSGTTTAVAIITSVLRDLPVRHAGYSGLMLPVLEDSVLAARWGEGRLTLDQLLAYSAICGTGLDTIPLPGDVTEDQLARIIGDMATLAHKLRKPLSARLMPVKGAKAGDRTPWDDPFIVNTTLQRLP